MSKLNINCKESILKHLENYCIPAVKEINKKGKILDNVDLYVGIIGTRNSTIYGERVVDFIVKELSLYNVCVVSGFMYGIDMYAHKASAKYNMPTIGVLGYGFDYLKNNSEYKFSQELILKEKGIFLSEFDNRQPPDKWTYPKRNRIVAGLSDFLIVVEAGDKSGSFITTDFAIDMGKDVFTIPGSIFSKASKGTNNLIKQGAGLITQIADIHEYIRNSFKLKKIPIITKSDSNYEDTSLAKKREESSKNFMGDFTRNRSYKSVIDSISKFPDGVNVDILASKMKIDISDLNIILTELEIDEIIKKDVANNYHLIV